MEPDDYVAGRPIVEGMWSRAVSDTWRSLNSPAFWGFNVIVSTVTTALGAKVTGIGEALVFGSAVVVVVLALFIQNAFRAPFRQRDEARRNVFSPRKLNRKRRYVKRWLENHYLKGKHFTDQTPRTEIVEWRHEAEDFIAKAFGAFESHRFAGHLETVETLKILDNHAALSMVNQLCKAIERRSQYFSDEDIREDFEPPEDYDGLEL